MDLQRTLITQLIESHGFLDYPERGIDSDGNNNNILDKLQDTIGKGQNPISILPYVGILAFPQTSGQKNKKRRGNKFLQQQEELVDTLSMLLGSGAKYTYDRFPSNIRSEEKEEKRKKILAVARGASGYIKHAPRDCGFIFVNWEILPIYFHHLNMALFLLSFYKALIECDAEITQLIESHGFLDYPERGIDSDGNNNNLLDKLQDTIGKGSGAKYTYDRFPSNIRSEEKEEKRKKILAVARGASGYIKHAPSLFRIWMMIQEGYLSRSCKSSIVPFCTVSPGVIPTPVMKKDISGLVNMYRVNRDAWDTWGDVAARFDVPRWIKFIYFRDFAAANKIGAKGLLGRSWPDLDMLPVGWLSNADNTLLESHGFLDYLERGIDYDGNNNNLLDKLQDTIGRGQNPISILPTASAETEITTISDPYVGILGFPQTSGQKNKKRRGNKFLQQQEELVDTLSMLLVHLLCKWARTLLVRWKGL
ncbi:DENN domain and WD repeat-containing protein [Salix suchowensis]|nr:DENN domain and WD repeat-containing protein [Salix suchowensis]